MKLIEIVSGSITNPYRWIIFMKRDANISNKSVIFVSSMTNL